MTTDRRPLRVLMLSTDYPPDAVGGIGAHVRMLCRALVDAGQHVRLLFSPPSPRLVLDDPWVEMLHTDLPLPMQPELSPAPPTIKVLQANIAMAVAAMSRSGVDVIHCHDLEPAPAAYSVADTLGLPVVLTKHFVYNRAEKEWLGIAEEQLTRYAYDLESWCVRRASRVVAVSESIRIALEDDVLPGVYNKVDVSPNGSELASFAVRESASAGGGERHGWPARFMAQVGRLHHEKGCDIAIRALALLQHSDVSLLFAGVGPEEDSLRSLARSLGVEERVLFLGQLSPEDVRELYLSCEVVLAPSRSDWSPIAVCDALAMGCAIVAGDVGGVRELITDRQSGLLCRPADPADLATCVDELLSDRLLSATLSENAAGFASVSLTPERMAADVMSVYQWVVDDCVGSL